MGQALPFVCAQVCLCLPGWNGEGVSLLFVSHFCASSMCPSEGIPFPKATLAFSGISASPGEKGRSWPGAAAACVPAQGLLCGLGRLLGRCSVSGHHLRCQPPDANSRIWPLVYPQEEFRRYLRPGARVSTGCCEWQRDGAASAGGPSGDAVTPGLARSSQNVYGRHKHGHRAAGGAQGRCGFIVCCFHPCSAPSAFFSVSGLAPKGTARGSAGWPWCSVGTWGGLARHVGICAYVCRARTPMSLPRKFFFFKASIVAVGA